MATDKLKIYNGALRLIGERKTTLTEDRAARRYLDDAWDDELIRGCLEEGYWTFAIRSIKMEASASIEPDNFGYRYAFERPDDYVKTDSFCSDGFFRNAIVDYDDEAGVWYCDVDTVFLKYVSDDAAYGGNMGLWPRSFQKFMQAELADSVKELITGNDGKYERIKSAKKEAKLMARNKDSMNKAPKRQKFGSFVGARMRGVTDNDGQK